MTSTTSNRLFALFFCGLLATTGGLAACGDEDEAPANPGTAGTSAAGGTNNTGGSSNAAGGTGGGSAGDGGASGDAGSAGSAAGGGSAGAGGSAAPDLAGRWKSICVASPQADGSTQYFDLDFIIDEKTWGLDYVVHGNADCTAPFVKVRIEGPYELTAPSTAEQGAWEGTFSFSKKTVSPGMEAAVGFLQGLPGCGNGVFAVGTETDVLSAGCPGLGQYPESSCKADYDLVRREGDDLQFGARPADNNMCTPDKRPGALSPLKLKKQ
jgi:hypothetical protein